MTPESLKNGTITDCQSCGVYGQHNEQLYCDECYRGFEVEKVAISRLYNIVDSEENVVLANILEIDCVPYETMVKNLLALGLFAIEV